MSGLDENLEIIAARIGSPWGEGATYQRSRASNIDDIKAGDSYISHLDDHDRLQFIEDIKRAFIDAGYVTVHKDRYRDEQHREYVQYTIERSDGSGELVRVPQFAFMTGQEWYDRFYKELGTLEPDQKFLEAATITQLARYIENSVMQAAKKAAGLGDEDATT